jgi:hypothetical protein
MEKTLNIKVFMSVPFFNTFNHYTTKFQKRDDTNNCNFSLRTCVKSFFDSKNVRLKNNVPT